jgi:hypothetical protein
METKENSVIETSAHSFTTNVELTEGELEKLKQLGYSKTQHLVGLTFAEFQAIQKVNAIPLGKLRLLLESATVDFRAYQEKVDEENKAAAAKIDEEKKRIYEEKKRIYEEKKSEREERSALRLHEQVMAQLGYNGFYFKTTNFFQMTPLRTLNFTRKLNQLSPKRLLSSLLGRIYPT